MAALEQLYRRYYRLVRWVLRGSGVAESALDDRVHDVFLAIHRRLPQRDPDVPMRQWIAGVARNVAFSHRRTLARQHRQLEQLASPIDDPPLPDEQLARQQAWRALHGFLEQLSPEQREVFVMVDITGMRVSELAATTGEPAKTLHSRLRVARVRFGHHFDASDDTRTSTLRRAARQARPSPQQRRRTWAGIVAAVGGPESLLPASSLGSTGSSTSTLGTWLSTTTGKVALATAAAGMLTVAAVGGSAIGPSRSTNAAATDPTPAMASDRDRAVALGPAAIRSSRSLAPEPDTALAGSEPVSAPPPPVRSSAIPATPSRASSKTTRRPASAPKDAPKDGSTTADPDAAMAAALLAIRRARAHLTDGRGAAAIAELDRFDGGFGGLEREHLRLRLEAHCALDDRPKARAAAKTLAASGVAVDVDAPCPSLAAPSEQTESRTK